MERKRGSGVAGVRVSPKWQALRSDSGPLSGDGAFVPVLY